MAKKVAIIILNWNGAADTIKCLESVQFLSYPKVEIIVVDNGSSDDSAQRIQKAFPDLLLVQTGKNLGFAAGNNVGIEIALKRGADYLVLLNNDTVVAKDMIECWLDTFAEHPQAGILGAKIFLMNDPERLDHLGGNWNPKAARFQMIGLSELDAEEQFQTSMPIDYVCGAGLIIKRAVIETIGNLEPAFFLIWEEADFCFRARRAGFEVLSCTKAKLWHKVSASFIGGKLHSTYFWWRSRLLWIERNCTLKERWSLYIRILIPDILHMLKIRCIKKCHLKMEKFFKKNKNFQDKERKLLQNRAALCGVRDYLLRKFDQGPDWILFDARTKK